MLMGIGFDGQLFSTKMDHFTVPPFESENTTALRASA